MGCRERAARFWSEPSANEINSEVDRRQAAKLEASGGDERERLYRILDLMHERRTQAPGYVPPSPAQRPLALQDLDQYFRSRANKTGSG